MGVNGSHQDGTAGGVGATQDYYLQGSTQSSFQSANKRTLSSTSRVGHICCIFDRHWHIASKPDYHLPLK
jgi:hypothetical protein